VILRFRRTFFVAFLACGLGLCATSPGLAQNRGDVAEKKEDLKELRSRIETLRKDLSASEESRADAADRLRAIERQISAAQQKLTALENSQARLRPSLADLARQSRTLESTLAQQQADLEKLLYRQYLQGAPDALRLLLNGDDPNQMARDLYYLTSIAHRRSELLADMRATLRQQKRLTEDTRARAAELADVEEAQRAQHAELLAQKKERQAILDQIAGKVKAQRREIGALERDEKRLSQLVDRLTRMLAEQAKRTARPAPPARGDAAGKGNRGKNVAPEDRAPAQNSAPENRQMPTATTGSFARLQGQLRLPARGQVIGRFGAPRDGGGNWKGLFIRAAAGSEVKAIAAGQVVYAEWMRGFGNLLIIDHGDGYLSVYGHNEALLKPVGERVQGGETVASVGNSGGSPDSGLYFELRHQGQALDPMKWVSIK
jgi:septal ring factor EnvC (AmiA/AmiB activator)